MIDRNEAIARIRKALKVRSGKAWSVTGSRGTAWGWINIDAPPARRTWHFETGPDGKRVDNPKEINDPSRTFGHMSPDDREELARLLDETTVHHQGVSVSPDAREYYVLAAESTKIDVTAKFAQCAAGFQDEVRALAAKHGKAAEQVYGWWREYSHSCSAGDQSAIWSEFLTWHKDRLGEPVAAVPEPEARTELATVRAALNLARERAEDAETDLAEALEQLADRTAQLAEAEAVIATMQDAQCVSK